MGIVHFAWDLIELTPGKPAAKPLFGGMRLAESE